MSLLAEFGLRILLFWYYPGWVFRSDNIANSAQLSWTGAWAELGKIVAYLSYSDGRTHFSLTQIKTDLNTYVAPMDAHTSLCPK